MTANNTTKFAPVIAEVIESADLDIAAFDELEDQELFVSAENGFKGWGWISSSGSHAVSRCYDPAKFNKAIQAICNEYGLPAHEVEGPLLNLHVFGTDTRKLSTEAIINLWTDHCHQDVANDYDYFGGFDAA